MEEHGTKRHEKQAGLDQGKATWDKKALKKYICDSVDLKGEKCEK